MTVQEGVQEYFLIHCRTQVSKCIFLFTVASGCPGVLSNSLSHAGVQDYFQIDCRTRGSRSMIDTVDTVDTFDTVNTVDTIEHY